MEKVLLFVLIFGAVGFAQQSVVSSQDVVKSATTSNDQASPALADRCRFFVDTTTVRMGSKNSSGTDCGLNWDSSVIARLKGAATEDMAYRTYSANGGYVEEGASTELVTLATGTTTTDTTANLLPANSLIRAVVGVVNTTITTACTGWQLGDSGAAGRFTANDTTLTAGESSVGLVQWTGTVAPTQAAAAKVRITCAGGNPGAGKVRVTVYYTKFVPAGS